MSSKLLSATDISDRLSESFDPQYSGNLYNLLERSIGKGASSVAWSGDDNGSVPDYKSIVIDALTAGQSRRILNTMFSHLSRVGYSEPEPEFPKLDKWTAELRKQFWLMRALGNNQGLYAFSEETSQAFNEGDGLGLGYVQFEFKTNEASGRQRMCLHHQPSCTTFFDRGVVHPGQSDFICFTRYIRADRAIARWGENARPHIATYYGGSGSGYEALKIYEYFDAGGAGKAATRAIIPVLFENAPLEHTDNVFGVLPVAWHIHFLAPMMGRPIGRILMQTASEEILNIMEAWMTYVLKRPSFDAVDLSQVDIPSWNLYQKGLSNTVGITGGDAAKAIQRVPGMELPAAFIQLRNWYEQQFNADSGTTEYDRGSMPEGDRTKFEVGQAVARSDVPKAWSRKQAMAFYRRCVMTGLELAKRFDRDPVTLDVFGYDVELNGADPRLALDLVLSEYSDVKISEDSIDSESSEIRRQQRMANLKEIAPLVGQTVDPIWFTEQMLRAIGEKDPKEAMIPGLQTIQAQPPLGQPQPGQPLPLEAGMMQDQGMPPAPAAGY